MCSAKLGVARPAQTSQATSQAVQAVISTLTGLASTVRNALSPQSGPATTAQVHKTTPITQRHIVQSHMTRSHTPWRHTHTLAARMGLWPGCCERHTLPTAPYCPHATCARRRNSRPRRAFRPPGLLPRRLHLRCSLLPCRRLAAAPRALHSNPPASPAQTPPATSRCLVSHLPSGRACGPCDTACPVHRRTMWAHDRCIL